MDNTDTPMFSQYKRIKAEYAGNVLFFRLGDFYEMFAEDAIEVSALLNLTLTNRNGLPMCGVPYHASRSYIARLLKAGKKVAICEQMGEPTKGKTLIERGVVEIITPGTTVDEDFLEKGSSNYLACLFANNKNLSFSYIELSTGEFCTTLWTKEAGALRLRQELERLDVKEIVVPEALLHEDDAVARAVNERGLVVNRWADWLFDADKSCKRLKKQFGVETLAGFGLSEKSPCVVSSGLLLEYLDGTARRRISHIRPLRVYGESEYMGIDESTMRNLELVHNLRDGGVRFSLLEVCDETASAPGRRLLKHRLTHPLLSLEKINRRLEFVSFFYTDQSRLVTVRASLGKMPDLERLCARIAMDRAHGKDMLALQNGLAACQRVANLAGIKTDLNKKLFFESPDAASFCEKTLAILEDFRKLLEKALADEPSILLTEGKLIRQGYNSELDKLFQFRDNGRSLLETYLEEEKLKTGISNLKIRYNRLIGYYFEVKNVHLKKVPDHFIKRQGLANEERYSTVRLAALESEINGASDKIIELEKKLFLELREKAKTIIAEISKAAAVVAELDVACSLARAATVHAWTKPVVNDGLVTEITEGRHPVVEAHLPQGEFIPNDLVLDASESGIPVCTDGALRGVPVWGAAKDREAGWSEGGAPPPSPSFALITGPNMAGKSTYLRQNALIIIMAQTGSFVPAARAVIGLVDRLYCRVGASDNLAAGESTFLVEMKETAYIMNTASGRSFVIMDEVGRGTSARDGFAIAQAVCEDLLNRIKCRVLFATHYHELTMLGHGRLVNRSLEVEDTDGGIIFRRRVIDGPAGDSYGLHVAHLAGVGDSVIKRASCILQSLKNGVPVPPAAFDAEKPVSKNVEKPDRKIKVISNESGLNLFDV
ncbi:DNA mismatch repair protein MutS [Spirochaetia bacterium]|nr:DNA mismatch repair protein MutS [Spirochaetia bacterium]